MTEVHQRPLDASAASNLDCDDWQSKMQQIEDEVRQSDEKARQGNDSGIRARWQSGAGMLAMRKGKQLPKGRLEHLEKALEVSRSELTARMKFATRYPEGELPNVISRYRTWFEIKQKALTTRPRSRTEDCVDSPVANDSAIGENNDDAGGDAARRRARETFHRGINIIEGADTDLLDKEDVHRLVLVAKHVAERFRALNTKAA